MRKQQGWTTDPGWETAEAVRLIRQALELGKEDSWILAGAAFTLAYNTEELDSAISLSERALLVNPNDAFAWAMAGWVRLYAGVHDVAIGQFQKAHHLNPLDPSNYMMMTGSAFSHFFCGRSDEAALWAEKALNEYPNHVPALRVLMGACASDGRQEKAEKALARIQKLNPRERISQVPILPLLRRDDDRQRLVAAFRVAGLPE